MQKLEENLKRREAVSAGNGDKIEDENISNFTVNHMTI
jgi:hypothetical protein